MRMLLMSGALLFAGMSGGCLVRETVTAEDGEVISDRYKVEDPLHEQGNTGS